MEHLSHMKQWWAGDDECWLYNMNVDVFDNKVSTTESDALIDTGLVDVSRIRGAQLDTVSQAATWAGVV